MNLLRFLLRTSWVTVALATAIGLLSGACNAGILALVNTVLNHTETVTTLVVLGFVGLGLARVLTSAISQYMLSVFAHKTMAELRRDLCLKILVTPLRHLENIGPPRLLVALTEDVIAITMALRYMPNLAIDAAMVIGCFAYLGWLSWTTLLVLLGITALGLSFNRVLFARAFHFLKLAREEQDTLFRHFRALSEGIKELRIHRKRRETFFSQHIHPTTEAFMRHNIASTSRFVIAHSWNHLFFILLIGLVLLILPALKHIGAEVLTGYILTILYLMGPLRQITNSLPIFGRANIALRKVEQLGLSGGTALTEGDAVVQPAPVRPWKRLELQGGTFAYQQEGEDGNFILGPIDLTLRPGELVFVVGGNGSGKSTLVKLLTGLYPLEAGELRLDGQPITDQNREWYRQHFSVVFSDFYLFERLLGLVSPGLDARAKDYLMQLQLDHKVKVQDGVLSTTALSQGQRKRLALLTAYLEDRPIYIFDEWAADQDPQFKELFYTQLLPELKTRGKAVLVISHDDRYFHLADRMLKLDYGKPVDSSNGPVASFTAHSRPQHI
jgi:putative ATP-binding cassette transporter